ncbi:MAG: hypothetical protein WBA97_20280 [Actinophytocola sp.]|uniref:hypothetical protein n=1 Tax=Actinophytocola sp. TaxID=1872138 RepID=UPI003C71145D
MSWDQFSAALTAAATRFAAGDPEPYKALWAHDDDVCLMGAYGGVLVGWPRVAARMDHVSRALRSEADVRFSQEVVRDIVTSDFAHSCRVEQFDHGPGTELLLRRVTLGAKPAQDRWWIVHQHSDPLLSAADRSTPVLRC